MNLRSIDLNLLVVLDALLDEAHVSRAAAKLNLSQPAASSALDRCRHLFGDPLLERGKGGMRLTPRADALRDPLKTLLAGIAAVVDAPEEPLAEIRRTVRIVTADHPGILIVGPLHRALAGSAPGIDIVIQPWHGASAALEALARGASDIAVSVFPSVDAAAFHCETVLEEHYVVAMRRDHPAARGFSLDGWLAYPHILVSGRGDTRSGFDDQLSALGRSRRVGIVVPSFLMVPPLLEESDLIAMMPSHCVPADAAARFHVARPPIPVPGFPLHIAWHRRREKDRAVQHVADMLRDLLAGADAPALTPASARPAPPAGRSGRP
ncbi:MULTISPECIES: LysR family transcriptional regulator [unclassified Shinella]|uniref:LysR family transcriptional regulator n=1 Tax=unclassified Shinella TaxID=2643062 RepID=UPI00225D80A0|nr:MULTISPECIES: LysR family transcriptional regulator [unclassified Shinella]MCO5138451.1 LysR family transcriptional regulator [Shinella sp.]MDC7255287.1 LysR family transcriptional regulator [Shinella sp. YE25]CAI0338059.1 HTH-type transcriptional activator NahR [Rhizobiaceae bacterium]CAK7256519.1 HTH-type transcriptional activator NahR [Shinella sp. WSC3-e]